MTSTSLAHLPLETYRQQFPALANKSYFNYGGQGPMAQAAIAAVHQAHHHIQQIGPFSDAVNRWMSQEMHRLRQAIATDLTVSAQTITLTESVSAGCAIALLGIDWQAGDHMLLSDCEHPGIVAVALEIQRRYGVEVSFCPLMDTLNAGDPVAVVTEHLRPNTRLVVISHVLWNTGQVLPLADICAVCHAYPTQAQPVRVLVDAAQSVGVLPLNLADIGVDFYAFTGHKWLCGPAGAGGFYTHPEALDSLQPTFVGWRAIRKDTQGNLTGWEPDGRRFEVATSDCGLYAGLREAIALHAQWGHAGDRYRRILTLSHYLWQKLSALSHITCLRTAPPESGLVSFQVHGLPLNHNQIVQNLEKQGFYLRTILQPDCIRACVHYFTLESEIDQLVEALQR
jgi:L-cysteine/cystine lyase